jgi:hypothetical protein
VREGRKKEEKEDWDKGQTADFPGKYKPTQHHPGNTLVIPVNTLYSRHDRRNGKTVKSRGRKGIG